MKLTPSQIEYVEHYLLSCELSSREFYEEMLDHWVVDIENRMSAGVSFNKALSLLTDQFAGIATKPTWLAPTRYGLKGLENKYVRSKLINFKKNVFGLIREHTSKTTFILWLSVVVGIAFAAFPLSDKMNFKLSVISVLGLYLLTVIGLSFKNFKNLKAYIVDWHTGNTLSQESLKFKQLTRYDETYVFLTNSSILFALLNLGQFVSNIHVKIIMYALIISFALLYLFAFLSKTIKKKLS